MSKNNVYGGFFQALFLSGSIAIPKFLFDHYTELGITDREMILIIHIMSETNAINQENIEEQISKKMGIPVEEFMTTVKNLKERRLLQVNNNWHEKGFSNHHKYDISGLIDQLFELWGIDQFKLIEKGNERDGINIPNDFSLAKLTALFERELGRPLTGLECEHIEKWLLASYSEELIVEALRRGVSAGIRNFRYLDSILREWEKKGIKTKSEVDQEDQNFQARQEKKGERQKKTQDKTKSKYDNIYL